MSNLTSPVVVAGAEPFSADGGPIGILLSHGFTGSPASMRPWGEFFAAAGHTVRVPRLPGHGTTWQDMNTTGWDDWFGELETTALELSERCEFVAMCGLSMGGGLSLRMAQLHPDIIKAVVLVNPAVGLKRLDIKFAPFLSRVLPSIPGVGNDIKKPGVDEIGYDKVPLKALASQLKGWAQTRADLAKVTQPLLYLHSTEDHVVDDLSATLILNGVSSKVAEYVRLRNSYHVATIDHDAPLIFDTSLTFIEAAAGR